VFILSAVTDILNSLLLHTTVSFSRYGLCVFVLAMAVMLARLYTMALSRPLDDPGAEREQLFTARGLTEREKEIARLVTLGLDNETIAERIFLSDRTVKFHIGNIYSKFGVDGRSGARAAFMAKVPR
jgi:DNA-binding NarL/FixJ family response regulator